MVVGGPLTSDVLFTVVVTVAAAPFKPGVKPETTPGVLVKTGGAATLAGLIVELHPSDIDEFEGSGALLDDIGAAGAAGGGLADTGAELFLSLGGAGAGAAAGRLPPGPGGGIERGVCAFDAAVVVEFDEQGADEVLYTPAELCAAGAATAGASLSVLATGATTWIALPAVTTGGGPD